MAKDALLGITESVAFEDLTRDDLVELVTNLAFGVRRDLVLYRDARGTDELTLLCTLSGGRSTTLECDEAEYDRIVAVLLARGFSVVPREEHTDG